MSQQQPACVSDPSQHTPNKTAMGVAASSTSSSASAASAYAAGGSAVLLASMRPAAGAARWVAVTDGTARGGDTVLSIIAEDAAAQAAGTYMVLVNMGQLTQSIDSLNSTHPFPEGALRLQGSLGALEGQGGRLVGFAIADCGPVDPALARQSVGTQGGLVGSMKMYIDPLGRFWQTFSFMCKHEHTGLRLSYRHDPPDARFQLRLLSRGLAPQESFVAPLPTPQAQVLLTR